MEAFLFLHLLITLFLGINGAGRFARVANSSAADQITVDHAIIYNNVAEIIQLLEKLPLKFSAEDWAYIRSDTLTLLGSNVTVTSQTITAKESSPDQPRVYVQAPSSSKPKPRFLKATLIDEATNLVKATDKNISPDPIFFTVPADEIFYVELPSGSNFEVDFTYDSTGTVFVSYLRSDLHWQARYQLYLYEEPVKPTLVAMAVIENDGTSKLNIQRAELIGGDTNLQASSQTGISNGFGSANSASRGDSAGGAPSVGQGTELAGVYVFPINQPFSIDAKTTYILSMFRPQVNVSRFALISGGYFYGAGESSGNAARTYRLTSDRFLPSGNCLVREDDYLVGETFFPNLAAKDDYEFSLGDDPDIVYNQTATLVSSESYSVTPQPGSGFVQLTRSTYNVQVQVTNYKTNRAVKVVYKQIFYAQSVTLIQSNGECTLVGSTMECEMTLAPEETKVISYDIEIVN